MNKRSIDKLVDETMRPAMELLGQCYPIQEDDVREVLMNIACRASSHTLRECASKEDLPIELICEQVVRHTEVSGSDCLEKNYIRNGEDKTVIASVWCVLGPGADGFAKMAKRWLRKNGYEFDGGEPQ